MNSTDLESRMKELAATYAASFETEYLVRQQERTKERKYWQEVTLPAILRRADRNRMLNQITNWSKSTTLD